MCLEEKGDTVLRKAKIELKTKEQILKERKVKAKKQAFQTHQETKKQKRKAIKGQH